MSVNEVDADSSGWRKARRSMGNGNCVEVRPVRDAIAVRDSQDPDGLVLAYSSETWRTFTQVARLGRFDVPVQKKFVRLVGAAPLILAVGCAWSHRVTSCPRSGYEVTWRYGVFRCATGKMAQVTSQHRERGLRPGRGFPGKRASPRLSRLREPGHPLPSKGMAGFCRGHEGKDAGTTRVLVAGTRSPASARITQASRLFLYDMLARTAQGLTW